MDDELGAEVKVLNGVLPDQRLIVTLVFDDAGQAVFSDALRGQTLLHVVFEVAHRADVCSDGFGGLQSNAALGAGEFLHFRLLGHGIDGLAADWAPGLLPLGLVEDYVVAAMGTFPSRQLVSTHIDSVATGTVNLLSGKEASFGLSVFPTVGTFNDKFRHSIYEPS